MPKVSLGERTRKRREVGDVKKKIYQLTRWTLGQLPKSHGIFKMFIWKMCSMQKLRMHFKIPAVIKTNLYFHSIFFLIHFLNSPGTRSESHDTIFANCIQKINVGHLLRHIFSLPSFLSFSPTPMDPQKNLSIHAMKTKTYKAGTACWEYLLLLLGPLHGHLWLVLSP